MTANEYIRIGVGAVVFRSDTVLIIKRGQPPFEGQWSIPGGGLEPGERLNDAAMREVMEETGVDCRIRQLLDVFEALPAVKNDFSQHTIMVDYIAEWVSGEPVADDDAAAAEFVDFETALARVSWDLTRQAIRRAIDLRQSLRGSP